MRRDFCLPLVGGDPLCEMASRLLMQVGDALTGAGHAVTYCRCRAEDALEFSFPAGEIHEVAAGQGCRVVDVPATVPIETEPRVGLELSYHLDRYLARRPHTDVIFPDAFGVGFYAMLAKNLGLRHRATTLSLLLLGTRRHMMADRSLYPTLEDVAAFHREERCAALADRVLVVSGHQLADAGPSRAFLAPLWAPDAKGLAPVAAAGHDYLCLTGLPEVEDVSVVARAIASALSSADRLSAPPRIHFLQWGQPHTEAQIAGIFRGLAGCRAEVSLDWFARGQVMPVLAAAGQVIVPAPAEDAAVLVRLAFASEARVLVQDHSAIRQLLAPDSSAFTRDHRTLARLLLDGATSEPCRAGLPVAAGTWEQFAAPLEDEGLKVATPAVVSGEPLVSVCMTMFNRTEFIGSALESIAGQSWNRLEVLLCDDGSTEPDAVRFLREFEEHPPYDFVRVLRQEHHSLGRNRNQALESARGEYIMFVDDDNIAKPHEVETFVAAAQRTGADALSCFNEVFIDPASPAGEAPPLCVRPFSGGDASVGSIHNCLGDANSFFPRRTFETYGRVLEVPERGYEDWELLLRIVLSGGRLEVVPESLYWYRTSPTAMTAAMSFYSSGMVALRPLLQPEADWPGAHTGVRQRVLADLAWLVKRARIRGTAM